MKPISTAGTPVHGNRKFIPFKHTGHFNTSFEELLILTLYKLVFTLNLKLIEKPDIIYIMIAGKGFTLDNSKANKGLGLKKLN